MKFDRIYIVIVGLVFIAYMFVFDVFPRSTISVLEKRELATFPNYTLDRLKNGTYTKEISSWFSDSEPYRDSLMTLSMRIKDGFGLVTSENDNVKFHASVSPMEGGIKSVSNKNPLSDENREVAEYENDVTADENAKIANAGIIIVGTGNKTRALMAYGGGAHGCLGYAKSANKY